MNTQEAFAILARALNGVTLESGLRLSVETVRGEVDVLIVTIEDREEFPIYVTIDDSQVLCIAYLWTENEVKAARRTEMLEAMLIMNVPMPLSAFSKIGQQYIIFDALRCEADVREVLEALEVLSDNTLTAIEEFSEFLQ